MPLQFVKLPSRLGYPKWGDAGLCFALDWVSSLGTDWVEDTAQLGGRRQSRWLRTADGFAVCSSSKK